MLVGMMEVKIPMAMMVVLMMHDDDDDGGVSDGGESGCGGY
jgi:hypothetical protein